MLECEIQHQPIIDTLIKEWVVNTRRGCTILVSNMEKGETTPLNTMKKQSQFLDGGVGVVKNKAFPPFHKY